MTTKKIETIGSVRFNTEKNKIVGFGENKRSVEVVSRFLSVDPLAQSYPFYTPYQFAGNIPIRAIDLDGKEPESVVEYNNEDGEYKFTKPAIALLSVVSGVDPSLISKTQVEIGYVKILGYCFNGGGAMTTNDQIDLTRHFFYGNSADNIHSWLHMNSHEVGHLPQRKMFSNGFSYVGESIIAYGQAGYQHDGTPMEIVADYGQKEFDMLLHYIGGGSRLPTGQPYMSSKNKDYWAGLRKIENIFTNKNLSENDKVDQLLGLYQNYIAKRINELLNDLQGIKLNDPDFEKKSKQINNEIGSLQDKDKHAESLKSYNNPNQY